MRFFQQHPNIKYVLSLLIVAAQIALLVAYTVTGSQMLMNINDILTNFINIETSDMSNRNDL